MVEREPSGDTVSDRPDLAMSEGHFGLIFQVAGIGTAVTDVEGRLLEMNDALCALLGYPREELIGLPFAAFTHPQDMVRQLQLFSDLLAGRRESYQIEKRYVRRDGAVVWGRLTESLLSRARSEPVRAIAMVEDVTAYKESEAAARESERLYRAVIDGAPVGISLMDRDGRYVSVNRVRQEMLGYSEEELIGRHYLDVTHPDDIELDERINAEARVLRKDHYQIEKRFLRRTGETIWSRITVAAIRDAAGEVEYSISIAEDITEAKRIHAELEVLVERERAAREEIERLAAERTAILTQVAEGIVIAGRDGRITFLNEAAERIYGTSRLHVPVEEYADAYGLLRLDGSPFPPEEPPLARAFLRGETVTDIAWRVRRPDGIEIVVEGTAAPLVADDGSRIGAVLTIRDVTAQHEFEGQKEEFLSAAAHDLRTPLATVQGHAQLLRRRIERAGQVDPEVLLAGLDRITAGTSRMVSLVDDLLDVANMELGRTGRLSPRPVDLVPLVTRVVQEHSHGAGLHEIAVKCDVSQIVGNWDPSRLERVVANLISNAIKYSPSGGRIDVEISSDESVALLRVRDHGVGIPSEDLPHIFERFRRGGNVASRVAGTGIGLAAVLRIVEQHGGTVAAESVEGEGSTFTVQLPR